MEETQTTMTEGSSPERQRHVHALAIYQAALEASDPYAAVKQSIQCERTALLTPDQAFHFSHFAHIYLIGAGKATAAMAQAIEDLLGGHLHSGLIIVKTGHGRFLNKTAVREANHPIPDKRGVTATLEMLDFLRHCSYQDLIICLFSGGGSALLVAPAPPVTLEDKQHVTNLLLRAGCTIDEINTVRKHLSLVKGGLLARAAQGATILTLALSDVIGNRLDVIASGPTVPDYSTYGEALHILREHQLLGSVSPNIIKRLEDGQQGLLEETPKEADPCFTRTTAITVGSIDLACQAAEQKARALGYDTRIISTQQTGDAHDVAAQLCTLAKTRQPQISHPLCLISGGETTVTVKGSGLGGRNQELALAASLYLDRTNGITCAALATDGSDGPTDATGAIVDGTTHKALRIAGIDACEALRHNDAYHALDRIGALVKTGPTGTNVNDLIIVLIEPNLRNAHQM
jgi:hydroxypyruvate reductase